MHIIFQKDELNKALTILSKAAQNKVSSNLPGTIYMNATKENIRLEANDFEIGITMDITGQVEEEGTILLSSKLFQDLVKKLPENTLSLKQEENTNTVHIQSGNAEFDMVTYDVNDFTYVERIEEEGSFRMDTKDLKTLIDLTSFALSTDESRQIFTGALLQIRGKEIIMVGTDTHRMAIKKIINDEDLPVEVDAIIPGRVLAELGRLLPVDEPQIVEIRYNKNQIAFLFEKVYFISRLVDGRFPDYEAIIPKMFHATATINRRQLIDAVDRVSILSKDVLYHAIRFDWSPTKVILSSQNADIGSGKEEILCHYEGEPMTISFNGRYIIDILKRGTGDDVILCLTDRGPLVVRLDENPNYTYVATPIRTS